MNNTTEYATVRQVSLPTGKTATHEARSGAHYELSKTKPTYMTLEDAYSFLVDTAFEVRSATREKNPDHDPNDPNSQVYVYDEGDLITPVSTKKVEGGRVNLDEDEVIAKLDELTHDALLKRCKRIGNSGNLTKATKKDDLIQFLVDNKPQNAVGLGRGSEGAPPEMERSDLDNLLDLSDQLK